MDNMKKERLIRELVRFAHHCSLDADYPEAEVLLETIIAIEGFADVNPLPFGPIEFSDFTSERVTAAERFEKPN